MDSLSEDGVIANNIINNPTIGYDMTFLYIFGIGCFLFFIPYFLIGIAFIAHRCWDWIDEQDTDHNYIIDLIMKIWGWEVKDEYYRYNKSFSHTNQYGDELNLTSFILFLIPILIFFYQFTILILIVISLMWLARSVRRLYKKVNAHCQDHTIHK